jgi:predicted dehydrogenase
MDKLDWLLVGAGDVARKRVAAALTQAQGSRLVGVCDEHLTAAQELAKQHGAAEVFDDFDTALAKSSTGAVYIATPIHLHAGQAMQALASGRHVLVEKPLSLTSKEARELASCAQQSGLTAGCAYFRRLFPAFQHTANMLARAEFGKVLLVRMAYTSWFDPAPQDPKRWRVQRDLSGGGPVSDMGSHMLDVIIGLFGLPSSIYAQYSRLLHPDWDVEDTAAMQFLLPGGAQVSASFSWCSRTWQHEMEIIGENARLRWRPYDSGELEKTTGRETEIISLPPAANVHLPLVQDFVQAVNDNRQPVTSLEEAVKTSLLLDALQLSADEGRPVSLQV